jgi:hypothetical protein
MATRKVRTGSTRRRLARGQAGKMLGGAALLGAAWLLCGPVLQRSRQLELVLERPDEAGEAMFSLCRTEGGARALREGIAGLDEDRRARVLRLAAAQGCLVELPGELVAQHAMLESGDAASAQIAGQRGAGVEAAIDGLESADELHRLVALRALVSLEPLLSLDQRRRAASRLEGRPLSDARGVLLAEALAERPRALLIEIEEPEPVLEVPEPEPERAPGPGELRMPRLGESLRVGGGGVLFMAPAGGE